jgi:hypothetical protein
MLSRLRRWFAARFGSEDDGESSDSRFVPSPLDSSVRAAHGGNTDEAERELAAVEEEARRLEAGQSRE